MIFGKKEMLKEIGNTSKIISLDQLPDIIKYNVEAADNDKYQETTAKQIEVLQDKLSKANDTINEYKFWSIFLFFFVTDVAVIICDRGIFWLLILELIPLICAAKHYGQEDALRIIYWVKNIIENLVTKKQKGPSCD